MIKYAKLAGATTRKDFLHSHVRILLPAKLCRPGEVSHLKLLFRYAHAYIFTVAAEKPSAKTTP